MCVCVCVRACVCVFEWVLNRVAVGHIFPAFGPCCSPDPNSGTFILTSGQWRQPNPSFFSSSFYNVRNLFWNTLV